MDYRSAPIRLTMAIATLQGMCLLALYRTLEHKTWPTEEPVYGVPLWLFVLVFPLLLLVSLRQGNYRKTLSMSLVATLPMTLAAAYTGWQLMPVGEFSGGSMMFAFVVSMIIVTFKTAMYLQIFTNGDQMSYAALFNNSWRNFLVVTLSLVFLLVVLLLLLLWAQLFDVIGVEFFGFLFQQDWFLFPVLGFSFGVGIVIFRGLIDVIDNITSLLLGLIRLLLPMVVLLSFCFLASLLMVGTETLWGTGHGSTLVLWLSAVFLFFINAVYQDGQSDPSYSLGVHRFVSVGVLTLPVLAALSCYGLVLRIEQYGLTVERIYGVVVWLTLTLFSLGYAWGVIRRRDNWTITLTRVNGVMGLMLVGVLLLLASPILDPRKLALNSQLARLEAGDIAVADFDMRYVRLHLARPGYMAYQELSEQYGSTDPSVVQRWEREQAFHEGPVAFDVWERITLRPDDLQVPQDLRQAIAQNHRHYIPDSALLAVDMNGDDKLEYLLLGLGEGHMGSARFYYFEHNRWMSGRLEVRGLQPQGSGQLAFEGPVQTEMPRFLNVRIGGVLFLPRVDEFYGPHPVPRFIGSFPAERVPAEPVPAAPSSAETLPD